MAGAHHQHYDIKRDQQSATPHLAILKVMTSQVTSVVKNTLKAKVRCRKSFDACVIVRDIKTQDVLSQVIFTNLEK